MRILTSGSLKLKMTLAVSLLVSVILVLVGGINYNFWHSELKKIISTQQDALVGALARQLDDKLLSAQEQLKHFSRRIDRSVMENPRSFQAIMDEEDDVSVLFDGLLLISTTGKVIAEYPRSLGPLGSDCSGREYFKQTIATGKPVISSPYISTLKKSTIAFTVPVLNDNGGMTAILVGRHPLDSSLILSSLRELKIGTSGYLYIIDKDRDMVLHPDPKRIMEVLPAGLNAGLDRAINGFDGTIENTNSRGVSGLTSFKHLKSTNWILAAHNPLAEAYAPLHRAKLYALIILAGGILLSIAISRYVMSRLTAPLLALTSHVRNFPAKRGNERIFAASGADEIGQLGTAFNGLVTQLDEQNRTIEDETKFFGSLIQNAAAPMFVIDRTHTIIFWNNAVARLTGRSSFQMVGTKRQWEPFYPSKRPVLADLVLDRKLQSISELYDDSHSSFFLDGAYRAEGWYDNLGGKRRYISFEASPILDARHEIVAAVETLQDITHRKLAHEAMNSHNLFLQEILDAIPSPVFYKDTQGVYIGCNKAFLAFMGRTHEEMIGKTVFDVLTEEQAAENDAQDRRIISNQGGASYESYIRRHDGVNRLVLQTKATFSRPDGSVGGVVGAFVDITEQRLIQQELMLKHQELGDVFDEVELAKKEWEETLDCLKDFVILTDAEHHVRRCNRLLCDMTGKDFNEVLGRDWRDLLSEAGFSFTTFDGNSGELIHAGSQRLYDLNIYTMDDPLSERTNGLVVSLNDTTEIRSVTEELRRTSKELNETQSRIFQQEKMASIGQLAAGVAHEINNPMGFISSNLSTMGKYMEKINAFETSLIEAVRDKGDAEVVVTLDELRRKMKIDFILEDIKSLLHESRDGAERVRRIVQDLKSFSRVDEAVCKAVSINESLDTTLNMLRNEIKYVADVEREYDQDLPMLLCFPQRMNQVFMNILVNAAHAIEGHGVIKIKTLYDSDDIVVRISDTGKGIPPENLSRIFEPFFTTKEVGKGTGLGLSISYDIIKKHGGDMTVESEVGLGTTFIIRLPLSHRFSESEVAS